MSKLEAYSDKTKAAKIDGNWVKVSEEVQKFIRNVPFGSEVEVKTEGEGMESRVTFIKVTKKAERTFTPASEVKPVETDDIKLRSMALSYVKDLVAAGKIPLGSIIQYSNVFLQYIKTGVGPEELVIEETVK